MWPGFGDSRHFNLTGKIKRNVYINEEKFVSHVQILINKTFLLFGSLKIKPN